MAEGLRDELTGIPNRRALDEYLFTLEGEYSIAMVDIDHFKKFNDTWDTTGRQLFDWSPKLSTKVQGSYLPLWWKVLRV